MNNYLKKIGRLADINDAWQVFYTLTNGRGTTWPETLACGGKGGSLGHFLEGLAGFSGSKDQKPERGEITDIGSADRASQGARRCFLGRETDS
jgi:hypothetical protein